MKTMTKDEIEAAEKRMFRAVIAGFCPEHLASVSLLKAFGSDEEARHVLHRMLVGAVMRGVLAEGFATTAIGEHERRLGFALLNFADFALARAARRVVAIMETIRAEVEAGLDTDSPSERHAAVVRIWSVSAEKVPS